MNNPTSLAEILLGLDGFEILEVLENPDELRNCSEISITSL